MDRAPLTSDRWQPVEREQLAEALLDERVVAALRLALRDLDIREDFRRLRREGLKVREAVPLLRERYYLSEEHIRSIVYRKKK